MFHDRQRDQANGSRDVSAVSPRPIAPDALRALDTLGEWPAAADNDQGSDLLLATASDCLARWQADPKAHSLRQIADQSWSNRIARGWHATYVFQDDSVLHITGFGPLTSYRLG